ncbi:TetR/AcrR family transcriptional regulator [Ramlibacter sp. AW1]|uniref:TetR/AcrR family transcriptional regulator n=1 Tax=Ramlibacter aurantiacus TaxID=2801330 RepID=A0A936ZTP5_9BURK|nr:TetR/AcrR family transcriptional regulator [Ramlibacter aurantiacus]MBL0422366.1 TetR/AcrR family transcriptional regulator [Ramlibacter aurantiacus]
MPTSKAKSRTDPAVTKGQLTPERWIEAAIEVLVVEGIDHVRVDTLAADLGVTRGSFYWHFRDRDDLLRRVLQAWRAQATVDLTARLEGGERDPREQIRDVLTLPFRGRSAARAARIELAIRAWARRDDTARFAVDEADAARLAYIAQLFSALGFALSEARTRAALVYGFIVAESVCASLRLPPAQQQARNELVEKLLVGGDPPLRRG